MYIQSQNGGWVAKTFEDKLQDSGYYSHRVIHNMQAYDGKRNSYGQKSPIEATPEQIAHLDACIAAGKYLPYTEEMLSPNYSIY